jgi:hypothetical protein
VLAPRTARARSPSARRPLPQWRSGSPATSSRNCEKRRLAPHGRRNTGVVEVARLNGEDSRVDRGSLRNW